MDEKILKSDVRQWWRKKRLRYNLCLLSSGFVAFIAYLIIGDTLITPNNKEFEITFFSSVLQLIGFFGLFLLANICYDLGYYADIYLNKQNQPYFRQRLLQIGIVLSMIIVFIPVFHLLMDYFMLYA